MKRSRAPKCEPLAGINNQLAISGHRPSKTAKLLDVLAVSNDNQLDGRTPTKRPRKSRASAAAGGGGGGDGGGSLLMSLGSMNSNSNCGSSGDSEFSGSGKPAQQRNAANARERQRMRVLSKAFCRLKTSLPWVPPDTKLSKLDTLRLASCYIAHLKQILDDDQPSDGKSSRPGKQATAALSAVSASTSKLLSMALPSLSGVGPNSSTINTNQLRSPQFPTLPLMSWPFAARNQAVNSTGGSCRVGGSTNGSNGSNGGNRSAGGAGGETTPRHVGGQLGHLYAQFKDRLLMLPQQQQQQQQQQVNQHQQMLQVASKPSGLFHQTSSAGGHQFSPGGFSSSSSPWSSQSLAGISPQLAPTAHNNSSQMAMFCPPPLPQPPTHQRHQQQQVIGNLYQQSIDSSSSMLYAPTPPNCYPSPASTMSSCYYATHNSSGGGGGGFEAANFFQQQILNQTTGRGVGLQKCANPISNNRKTATTCPTV